LIYGRMRFISTQILCRLCDGRRVIRKWRDYAVNRTGDIPPFQLLDLFF
jgi:hypothetical protein